MKAFLATIAICFSLFVAGKSLLCQDCVNPNGNNCSSNLTTCNANITSCENGIIALTDGDNTTFVAFKACAKFPQCHSYFYSESIGNFHNQATKNCCTTDNCNADPIVLPPRNNTPNGVQCPFCHAENATTCEPQGVVNCTGLETKCLTFVGQVHRLDEVVTIASRSCITKEPCETGFFTWPDGPIFKLFHFSCAADKNDDNDGDDHNHVDHDD